jgi:phosphoglycerate dehydrogenase-like enzyme
MNASTPPVRIAVLDDYQGVARSFADWSPIEARAALDVFSDHLAGTDAVVERLLPYDAVCVMRERTPLPRAVLERLPRLKLICSTGSRNASIDTAAAAERGIEVLHTGYMSSPTVELTWALILAGARLLATPHIGFVSRATYLRFYGDTVANLTAWLDRRA